MKKSAKGKTVLEKQEIVETKVIVEKAGHRDGFEDLYSRRVVGWSMAAHRESRLGVDALALAIQRRLPGEGLLAPSDRGSQYASDEEFHPPAGRRPVAVPCPWGVT